MSALIKIENLKFEYPATEEGGEARKVLNGITMEIEEGSFVVVLGTNGGGKSTLAKHFNGILVPTEGRVLVNGIDTADDEKILEVRKTVGMVFQNPDNQIVANVVEEDVAFAPENMGVAPEEIRTRVASALETVGMTEYSQHAPHLLSGGQKQRVAIAGVIAMQPRCIVLDEPTAMLDPSGRKEVLETIHELNEKQNITVVLITHHMDEAIRADRVVIMSGGKIALDGKPEEVFSRVDELRALGLGVPDTTELIYELRQEGMNIPLEALGIEDCAQVIKSLLG